MGWHRKHSSGWVNKVKIQQGLREREKIKKKAELYK